MYIKNPPSIITLFTIGLDNLTALCKIHTMMRNKSLVHHRKPDSSNTGQIKVKYHVWKRERENRKKHPKNAHSKRKTKLCYTSPDTSFNDTNKQFAKVINTLKTQTLKSGKPQNPDKDKYMCTLYLFLSVSTFLKFHYHIICYLHWRQWFKINNCITTNIRYTLLLTCK